MLTDWMGNICEQQFSSLGTHTYCDLTLDLHCVGCIFSAVVPLPSPSCFLPGLTGSTNSFLSSSFLLPNSSIFFLQKILKVDLTSCLCKTLQRWHAIFPAGIGPFQQLDVQITAGSRYTSLCLTAWQPFCWNICTWSELVLTLCLDVNT